jgi:hypothetical protein
MCYIGREGALEYEGVFQPIYGKYVLLASKIPSILDSNTELLIRMPVNNKSWKLFTHLGKVIKNLFNVFLQIRQAYLCLCLIYIWHK